MAVFLALTGTAVALPGRNSVNSGDIINREVKRADIASDAINSGKVAGDTLTGVDINESTLSLSGVPSGPPSGPAGGDLAGSYPDPEIAESAFAAGDISLQGSPAVFGISPDAVQSAEVSANTLTGADIAESTLSDVPGATVARAVNTVNVQAIEFTANSGTTLGTVLNRTQGLRIRASCSSGGDLEVIADTDRDSRLFTWSVDSGIVGDPQLDNEIAAENFVAGSTQDLVYDEEGDQSGQTSFMTSGGNVVIVNWAADEGSTSAFGTQCAFVGTATSH